VIVQPELERVVAALSHVHDVPRFLQPARDEGSNLFVIFDNQETHGQRAAFFRRTLQDLRGSQGSRRENDYLC
jgi:hypothetical protein